MKKTAIKIFKYSMMLAFAAPLLFANFAMAQSGDALSFPVTFEEDMDWSEVLHTFGGSSIEVVDNPEKSGINTSDKVIKFTKETGGEQWAGAWFQLDHAIDLATDTELTIKVLSPNAGTRLLFKIENDEVTDENFEIDQEIGGNPNEWVEVTYDFSDANLDWEYFKVVFIFDIGADADGSTFYVDDINGAAAAAEPKPFTFPVTFEEDIEWDESLHTFGGSIVEHVDNPDKSGINTSDKVVKFTKEAGAEQWAGTWFQLDHNIDLATSTELTVKVWSPNAGTRLLFKIENDEVTDENFEIDQEIGGNPSEWVEVTYDFSEANLDWDYSKVVFIFDIGADADGSVFYLDDVNGAVGSAVGDDSGNGDNGDTDAAPTAAAPTPTEDAADVISVFSDAYTDLEDTNFNPNWGQSTRVSTIDIGGNSVLKYGSFNYQGTEFDSSIDASEMVSVHFDMWTANAATVNFTIISPGPEEKLYALDITHDEWVRYDIPLSYFDNVDLADIFQMKFEGGNGSPTIYLDNIYFSKSDPTSIGEPTEEPGIFALSQNYPNPFNPTTNIEFNLPVSSDITLTVYNMVGQRVATLANGTYTAGMHSVQFDAANLSSGMYIYQLQVGDFSQTRKMLLIK